MRNTKWGSRNDMRNNTMTSIWANHATRTGVRPKEEKLIINVAAATVLRWGIEEPSNKPNSLVKLKWDSDWHMDQPLIAVVRIHGGTVWTGRAYGACRGRTRRYCPQETHVYDISKLTRCVFPGGSYAALHGYAGNHFAGYATRIVEWEGR